MKGLDKHTYGPTTASFQALVARTLQEEEKPVRKKSFTVVLVTAILMIALAATALAAVINAQSQNAALRLAEQAMMDEYGFTSDLMRYSFRGEAEYGKNSDGQDVWKVTMSPVLYFDQLGTYTIEVASDTSEALSTHWSHEDADQALVASGDWSSPAWGAAQLQRLWDTDDIISAYREEKEAELGLFETWSLEEQAKYSQLVMDLEHPKEDMYYFVLPEEGDISLEDAIALAHEMIEEKYGTPAETMERFDHTVSLMTVKSWDYKEWTFYFFPKEEEDLKEIGEYRVEFRSPSGEQTLCLWYTDDFWGAAPALAEQGKLDAIYEKAVTVGFNELSVEERAAYYKLFEDAGYDMSRFHVAHAFPQEGYVSEAEAIQAATAAMETKAGFSKRAMALFTTRTLFIQPEDTDEPVWAIEFDITNYSPWIPHYRVLIDRNGEATQILTWENYITPVKPFDEVEDESHLPLSEKKRWSAADLEAMLTLEDEGEKILETQRDANGTPTMEGWAAHDQLWRDAGFGEMMYPHTLPAESDIQLDAAEKTALAAINEKYGLTADQLDMQARTAEFRYSTPTHTTWYLMYPLTGERADDMISVHIAADSGAVDMIDLWEDFFNG